MLPGGDSNKRRHHFVSKMYWNRRLEEDDAVRPAAPDTFAQSATFLARDETG